MKKKITMLLASLLLLGLGAVNAEVTKFYKPGERKATLAPGDKVMFYNTTYDGEQDRTGFLVDGGTNFALDKRKPTTAPIFSEKVGVWVIEKAVDNTTYYTINVKGYNGYVGIGGKTNNETAQDIYVHHWLGINGGKESKKSEQANGTVIEHDAISEADNVWLVSNGATVDAITTTWNGNANSFATWSTGHPYAIYTVVEAETADLEAYLAAAKTEAKTSLEGLAKLSISTAATAITELEAVALENNDLEAALNAIDAIVLGAKKSMDGKSIVFDNTHTDARAGLSITAKDGNAYGTMSEGDETIWTIKSQADGSFKLYNFVTNKYLNTPGTAALADEAGAACYKFIVTDANKVALVTTTDNKMLHQANYWEPNYSLLDYYNLNDAASLWTITEKEILISREKYDLATAARASLPYAIQQAYGLVTDAESYYSNWLSTQEGSYAALLDNASDTYFHSAYTDEAKAEEAETHYIQADLGEGKSIDEFYFYMTPRTQNGNNRPSNVTVSGSNNNSEYTEIAQITTTLDASTTPYMSGKLGTKGTNYRYIRLTVTSTNSGSKFFTLSELYFFPATNDVTSLTNAYNSFATASIIESAMSDAADALINAEAILALSNIKKEINALLTANESNHAETPALGQYKTDAYNVLKAAYNASDATQESLEEALAVFKASKNVPVYFITSAWEDGYPAGSAIYYDGEWKWKKANKFDKQMWMTIPSYVQENVPIVEAYNANGTSYEICDFLTGTVMRGKSVQIVKIADWEGAYNLQYNADGESTDAAQHAKDNGQLVNWQAAISTGRKASAWNVEYIGKKYDLNQLTEEKIEALASLKAAYDAKAYVVDAEIGDGLGKYTGNKDAITTVLNAGKAILDKSLEEQSVLSIEDINSAAAAINDVEPLSINLPEDGKYYRIRGANSNAGLAGYYITGNTNADGGRIALAADADVSTIYYYKDGKLKGHQSGKYIGLSSSHYTFKDNADQASAISFASSSYLAGTYTIKSADRYLHYTVYGETVEIGRCEAEESVNDSWILEEVEEKQAVTYIYKQDETEIDREVVKEFVGMPYPAATVALPLGYIKVSDTLEGLVSADVTEMTIDCEFDQDTIPFKFYESFDAVEEWYYLHFKNECYLYYAAEDSILDATKDKIDRADREAYAWAFVGDPLNGFQVVNKKAAETMGLKAALDGAVVGEGGHTFKLTASAYLENGFFMEAPDGDVAKRFNLQNGKVVYWAGADLGSTFTVSACPFGPVAELDELIVEAEALKTIVEKNIGDKIGEYTQAVADALAAAIVTAKGKGDAATAEDVNALHSVIEGTQYILPTAGKYYQLRSAVAFAETKAVYSDGSNPVWKTLNANDKTFFWEAVENEGGVALKNAADGKYMNGNATQSGAWSVGDTPANIEVKIFSKEENTNGYQYGVVLGKWQLHAAGHGGGSGTEGSIVSYNTDESGSASAWYLVEVELPQFYTITYNFKYDGVIKYTQTAIFAPGSEFPDFSVMLPYGVVIAAEKPAGTVTEDTTFDFDLKVEKELPFVAAASVDDINIWYYVQMHANSAVTAYLEDNGGNNIEWVDKSVEGSEIDSYLWGYVGDVWSGIKMVNKGTGRAIVSTSGDAVLGDEAKATAFIPANSQAGGNWFCLKYPESNYLNAQGSKVASYNDNDNGSSFLLTEYKVYALEVPSIGYGTFYSDNKLEIPETVQAYVATSVNAGEVILEQVTGVIPAHTGIIFSGGEGVHNFVVSAATVTAEFETNLLRGTTTKTLITPEAGSTYYVLEEGAIGAGLYIATLTEEDGTAFYNNANEAYLLVQTPVDQSEPVLTFRFGKQDGTKIEEAELNTQLPTVIYDLTGRRIPEIVEKGIYIINGKKVVIK